MRRWRLAVAAIGVGVTGACSDATAPEASIVQIEALEGLAVTEGGTLRLGVTALGADGAPLPAEEVEWASSDATTATVDGGLVTAVAPGRALVYAEVGRVRDSVAVTVRFADLGDGAVAFRVQGEQGARVGSTGWTRIATRFNPDGSVLGEATTLTTRLPDPSAAPSPQAGLLAGEASLFLSLRGSPSPGVRSVTPFTLVEGSPFLRFQGVEGVIVVVPDPDGSTMRVYLAVEPFEVRFDEVDVPDGFSIGDGVVRGSLSFEAAGLVARIDRQAGGVTIVGQVSAETQRIFAEFSTSVVAWPMGMGTLSFAGGGLATPPGPFGVGPNAWARDGAVRMELPVPLGVFDGTTPTDFGMLHLRVVDPAAGTFALTDPGEGVLDGTTTAAGPWVGFAAGFLEDGRLVEPEVAAFSSGGSLLVEEYVPPTATRFGLLRGSVGGTLTFVRGAEGSGTLSSDFYAPLLPGTFSPPDIPDRPFPSGRP